MQIFGIALCVGKNVMIKSNFFQYLWNVNCPVEGELDEVPFCHFGIEGSVPRKCTLCPYFFEGECLWQKDKKPSEFSLKITQATCSGNNALHEAFQDVIRKFSLSSYSERILLVIEGKLSHTTIAEMQEIVDMFHDACQEREICLRVYPNPSLEGVKIFIVQELSGDMKLFSGWRKNKLCR